MSIIPFPAANIVSDRFLALLAKHGITPPVGSKMEGELLSVSQLLEVTKNPSAFSGDEQIAILRTAAGLHDLAAKLLSVEPIPEFSNFVPHLRLIPFGIPWAERRECCIGRYCPEDGRTLHRLPSGACR
jgi:hypothetical protein